MGNDCIFSDEDQSCAESLEMVEKDLPDRKKRDLDCVISSMASRRLLNKYCNEDMAVPVFTHASTGDVLISCLELSCKCKLADHARLALFNENRTKDPDNRFISAGYHLNSSFEAQTIVRDKKNKRRSRHAPTIDGQMKGRDSFGKAIGGYVCVSSSEKEATTDELNSLKDFAEFFRRRRFELGYTQKDVAAALAEEYRDIEYTQPSIAKFEHLHFSPSRLHQMKMRLEKWLEEAERMHVLKGDVSVKAQQQQHSEENGSPKEVTIVDNGTGHPCNKRTALEETLAVRLRAEFTTNAYPSPDQFCRLAEELGLNVNYVRRWFANRRRREKAPYQSSQQQQMASSGEELRDSSPPSTAEDTNDQ